MTYFEILRHLVHTGRAAEAVADLEGAGWPLDVAFLWAARVTDPSPTISTTWV